MAEQVFINSYLVVLYARFWLGLSSIDNGTTWQWSDNSRFDYVFWGEGQPSLINNEKDCVTFDTSYYNTPGYFRVRDCKKFNFNPFIVCKKSNK
uniref:C-type lectin domain-containing protein n=1 Tax=Panagrolaimus superbus TaxID=310955 RepID=A0A914XXQ1_9BILA